MTRAGTGLAGAMRLASGTLNLKTLMCEALRCQRGTHRDAGMAAFAWCRFPTHYSSSGNTWSAGSPTRVTGTPLYLDVTEVVNPAVNWLGPRFSNVSSTLVFPGTEGVGLTDGL